MVIAQLERAHGDLTGVAGGHEQRGDWINMGLEQLEWLNDRGLKFGIRQISSRNLEQSSLISNVMNALATTQRQAAGDI